MIAVGLKSDGECIHKGLMMGFKKQKLGIVMIFISMSALNAADGSVCVDGTDDNSLLLAKALWDAERVQDLRVDVRSEVTMAEVGGNKHLSSTFESTAHGEVVGQSLIIRRDGATTCVFGRVGRLGVEGQ